MTQTFKEKTSVDDEMKKVDFCLRAISQIGINTINNKTVSQNVQYQSICGQGVINFTQIGEEALNSLDSILNSTALQLRREKRAFVALAKGAWNVIVKVGPKLFDYLAKTGMFGSRAAAQASLRSTASKSSARLLSKSSSSFGSSTSLSSRLTVVSRQNPYTTPLQTSFNGASKTSSFWSKTLKFTGAVAGTAAVGYGTTKFIELTDEHNWEMFKLKIKLMNIDRNITLELYLQQMRLFCQEYPINTLQENANRYEALELILKKLEDDFEKEAGFFDTWEKLVDEVQLQNIIN